MTKARRFVVDATACEPQRLVIGEGETTKEMSDSGRWIGSDVVMEVRR
jgi:hypothetical protein